MEMCDSKLADLHKEMYVRGQVLGPLFSIAESIVCLSHMSLIHPC